MNRGSLTGGLLSVYDLFFGRKILPGERVQAQLLSFPSAGALLGFVFAVSAWALRILTGAFPAGVLSSLLFVLALEIASEWKRMRFLTEMLTGFFAGKSFFSSMLGGEKNASRITPVFLFVAFFIVRVLCIGVIVYRGESSSLILVYTALFLLCGFWISEGMEEEDLFSTPDRFRAVFLAGAIAVCASLLSFRFSALPHLIVTAAAACACFLVFRKILRGNVIPVNTRVLAILSITSEVILLLSAMIG